MKQQGEKKVDNLIGHATYIKTNPEKSNRYKRSGVPYGLELLNEAHIYVNEFKEIENGRISVPISAIRKIEIYDKDSGATLASWVFAGIGIAAVTTAVLIVIILLTKSSCPFVYTSDGKDFTFTGEIFSGATQPGIERDDYLNLPFIKESEGKYLIKISNEVKEIQSVNLAELIIADHPENTDILIDKYGMIHSIHDLTSPVEARNSMGKNVISLVSRKDSLSFLFDDKESGKSGVENVVLKFAKPANTHIAKLLIRAKNSFWLDGLFLKFHSLFGKNFDEFARRQETAPGDKLREWSLNQKLPLSVYVEENGKWHFVDYFNIAGPMAFREDILPIYLDKVSGDTVKIKLECGFNFWELYYAGLDCSKDVSIKTETVPMLTAIDEKGQDVKSLLSKADSLYYIQPDVGNQVLLTFQSPKRTDSSRTVLLHTRGYYKILRDMGGNADKRSLRKFKKPGRMPEYSRELYDLLPKK